MKNKFILIYISFSLFYHFAYAQKWDSLPLGPNNAVTCLYADTFTNTLYVGGNFTFLDTMPSHTVAKWNGSTWSPVGIGEVGCGGACPPAFSIIRYNGELYAGGFFSNMDASPDTKGIAKWNGTNWVSVGGGMNYNYVSELNIFNGKLYACGGFDTAGNVHASNIAVWNDTVWSPVANDTSWNGDIIAMAVYNGELYIGGNFYDFSPGGIWRIAKWNGSNWVKVGNGGIYGGADDPEDMVVYNNELYVAGSFRASSGNVGNYIQRFNGTTWSDVGGGMAGVNNNPADNAQIHDLEVHNGKLYAAGVFQYAGGVPAQYIAIWDGIQWCGIGSSFDNVTNAIAFYNDTLYIGGGFWTIDGDSMNYIAKWIGGGFTDTCGNTSGINENNISSKISIYPNPTTGIFTITSTEKISSIKITNVIGEEIFTSAINHQTSTIDLSSQSKGIYFIKLFSEKGIETKKIILQ